MPKPYYADYATHAFRFYVRYPRANVSDCAQPADRENWRVCDEIYSASSVCDQKIIDIVFCYNLPLKSAVSYAAARTAKSLCLSALCARCDSKNAQRTTCNIIECAASR